MSQKKSADTSHRDKKGAITKASHSTDITPSINLNPTIADMKRAYPATQSGTAMDLRGVTPGDPDHDGKPMTAPTG